MYTGGVISKFKSILFYPITGEENQKREEKGRGKISNLMKLYTPLENVLIYREVFSGWREGENF